MSIRLEQLAQCLHPLSRPPSGPGWNRAMLQALQLDTGQTEASVLLAIRQGPDGPEMLFTRRTEDLTHHAGQVSFPGGRAEPGDENALATALREAEEEIALPASAVQPLGFLDRLETTSGFAVTPVVATIHGQPALRAQEGEVAEIFAVPLQHLLQPANFSSRRIDTPVGPHQVSETRYNGHVIWGVTAMIVLDLQRRLSRVSVA